jgi:hypothetical protein
MERTCPGSARILRAGGGVPRHRELCLSKLTRAFSASL